MLYRRLDDVHKQVRNLVWIAGGEDAADRILREPSNVGTPQPSATNPDPEYATVHQMPAVAIGRPAKLMHANSVTGLIDIVTGIPMESRYAVQFFAFNELAALTRAALFDAWVFTSAARQALIARGIHHYGLGAVQDVTGVEEQAGSRQQDRADREWIVGFTLITETADYAVGSGIADLCPVPLNVDEVYAYNQANP